MNSLPTLSAITPCQSHSPQPSTQAGTTTDPIQESFLLLSFLCSQYPVQLQVLLRQQIHLFLSLLPPPFFRPASTLALNYCQCYLTGLPALVSLHSILFTVVRIILKCDLTHLLEILYLASQCTQKKSKLFILAYKNLCDPLLVPQPHSRVTLICSPSSSHLSSLNKLSSF